MSRLTRTIRIFPVLLFVIAFVVVGAVSAAPVRQAPPVDFGELLSRLWNEGRLSFILGHVLLNTTVAVFAAIRSANEQFLLQRLGEFLYRKALPYGGAYVASFLLAGSSGLEWLPLATFGVVEATLSGDLIDNLGALGVPIPDVLKRLTGRPVVTTDYRPPTSSPPNPFLDGPTGAG